MVSGNPNKHFMYSLNVDTGGTNAGWPADVNAAASYNGIPFISTLQEQRGSLALVKGLFTWLTRASSVIAANSMAGLWALT